MGRNRKEFEIKLKKKNIRKNRNCKPAANVLPRDHHK